MQLRMEQTEEGHRPNGERVDVELVNRFLEHLSVWNFAGSTVRGTQAAHG
jgi:hypothetical protein